MGSPWASRGSAIHVFLVITYFVRSLSKMSIFRLLNSVQFQLRSACESIQPLLINCVGHNSSLVRVVFPVALGTGVRGQVNHSEALGGQQDSMAFIKIRLVRLFTALAVKTRKKRAIFTSEETKTTIMLRALKKKEKQTTKFTSVTYVWSWLRG